MNKPRDRVNNKVNALLRAFTNLEQTLENNAGHIGAVDREKIRRAVDARMAEFYQRLDNPKLPFKLF